MTWNRVVWILAIVFAMALPATAQDKRLSIKLEPLVSLCRTGGPFPIEWRCVWSGTGILEGEIQFQIQDWPKSLGSFSTGTIILSGGEQRFRQILPPMETFNQLQLAEITVRFVTKSQTFPLGSQTIRIPNREQGVFTVAACDAWDIAETAPAAELEHHLEMEQFDPQRRFKDRDLNQRPIVTISTRIVPQLLSNEPLGYTGYDALILAGDGLAGLKESQLRALRQWVEAGGSLLISPAGTLQSHHLAFLNGLVADQTPGASPFLLDGNGRLLDGDSRAGRTCRRLRTGLGRTVILQPEALPDFKSDDWVTTVKFLWKFRHAPSRDLKPVDESKADGTEVWTLPPLGHPQLNSNWFVRLLMPKNVQTLPLGLMGAVLALYILCVGPLDYFVLGRLRMRKWTWLLFPVLTFGFAGSIVSMSNWSMQRGNVRQSAVIADVIAGNKVARVNRFEMLFLGATQKVETTANRATFVAIETQQDVLPAELQVARARGQLRSSLVSTPRYSGWIPGPCTVSQDVPQWTPQLNRLLTIAPAPADYPAGFDWDSVRVAELKSPVSQQSLRNRLKAEFGPETALYVVNRSQDSPPNAAPPVLLSASGAQLASPVHQIERFSRQGLFQFLSQVSPAGSANPTDLPLLDDSDPNQWLLYVVVPRENEVWIYRRIYRGDE